LRQIQYVSRYIALSEEGLVPKLECPMDQGLLLSNMDLQDNIYLYCISCDYKNFIGTSFYDKLVLLMNGINNG
jgi:hypothetical protein